MRSAVSPAKNMLTTGIESSARKINLKKLKLINPTNKERTLWDAGIKPVV